LADHIRREIEASDFRGEDYRKIWARLRVAGVRSSPRRVRRVMGENGLLAPHRVGRNQEKMHDGTIVTDKANEMWGTDMSQTVTLEEGRAYVFVAVEPQPLLFLLNEIGRPLRAVTDSRDEGADRGGRWVRLCLRLIFARRASASAPGVPFDLSQGSVERGMRPVLHVCHGFKGMALRIDSELMGVVLLDVPH
jgi:hypothetical protein